MTEASPKRRCATCYFCRDLGGTLHCVRNAPDLNRKTGEARWPRVRPADICGAFRCCDGCPLESDCWPRHDLPIYTDAFGDYCKIPLTKSLFVKVDPEDYLWLSQFRWHCKFNKNAVYAVREVTENGRPRRVFLHRMLMNTPEGKVCDHINHDGLDDRKGNLRNCTIAQNNANRRRRADGSSQYIGVSWDKRRNKWVAHIKKDGRPQYLGGFDVEEDAARAYDAAAWAAHGPFANLNFPEDYPSHPANRGRRREEGLVIPAKDCHPRNASVGGRKPGLPTAEAAEGRRGTACRVGSQPTREGPFNLGSCEKGERDLERRMGLSPCGSEESRAKPPRSPRQERRTQARELDSLGPHTKAPRRKGKRNRKTV